MSEPVLVGVALDDRDSGPIGLGIAPAGLAGGRLALVHAYPYERVAGYAMLLVTDRYPPFSLRRPEVTS